MKGIRCALMSLPLLALLLMTGCASVQPPVPMDSAFWSENQESIGVMVAELPVPTVVLSGNQGLLDYAINSGMATGLRNKVETWDASALNELSPLVVEQLSSRGYKVKLIQASIDTGEMIQLKGGKLGFSPVDLRPLKEQYKVDKLVLFIVTATGTVRTYYSVVPTSDPIVQVGVNSYVVDLDDNRLLFYQGHLTTRATEGHWDEGPEYPTLTNTFYQALDAAQQTVLVPFASQQVSVKQP